MPQFEIIKEVEDLKTLDLPTTAFESHNNPLHFNVTWFLHEIIPKLVQT
jgi:hypothetical protein